MANRIDLRFDNTITGLAGYQYGKKVFEEQVKKQIDYEKIFHCSGVDGRMCAGFCSGGSRTSGSPDPQRPLPDQSFVRQHFYQCCRRYQYL